MIRHCKIWHLCRKTKVLLKARHKNQACRHMHFSPENRAPEGCPYCRPYSWPVLFTHIKKPCNLLRLTLQASKVVLWAFHWNSWTTEYKSAQVFTNPSSPTGIFGRGDRHPIVFFHNFSHINSSQAVKCQYNPQNISLLNKAEEQ